MRNEAEMLDLIVGTAREDERIRGVVLNGSRANPAAPRDPFQDFDVVYLVTDLAPFKENHDWIGRFGELMILQMPDEMGEPPPSRDRGFAYLMQFTDGNRIDLTLYPSDNLSRIFGDSLSVVLLDKDGLIGPLPPPSAAAYLPKPPSAKVFSDCCNEFWWVAPYVAKGLWREELTYARAMLDQSMRDELMKMLEWSVGVRTRFLENAGYCGKYLRNHLEPELWDLLEQTYADARADHTWEALFAMCRLFRQTALEVAGHFGFEYPNGDEARVTAHLRHVRDLPRNAREIY
jgi:aminoglycoside 6-adenylyltransferase